MNANMPFIYLLLLFQVDRLQLLKGRENCGSGGSRVPGAELLLLLLTLLAHPQTVNGLNQ